MTRSHRDTTRAAARAVIAAVGAARGAPHTACLARGRRGNKSGRDAEARGRYYQLLQYQEVAPGGPGYLPGTTRRMIERLPPWATRHIPHSRIQYSSRCEGATRSRDGAKIKKRACHPKPLRPQTYGKKGLHPTQQTAGARSPRRRAHISQFLGALPRQIG